MANELTHDLLSPNTIEAQASKRMQLSEDQFKLISDWYHMAILALSALKNCNSDPRWIANRLQIPVETANTALVRMENLGLIKTKPYLIQIAPMFEVFSLNISKPVRQYHKQVLNLAGDKIDHVENKFRDFQSILFPFKATNTAEIRKLIDRFTDQASEIAKRNPGKEIYMFNVQFFPVTKLSES